MAISSPVWVWIPFDGAAVDPAETASIAGVWRCPPSSELHDPARLYKAVGDVRTFAFDFGDIEELIAEESITSASVSASGDVDVGAVTVDGYRVKAVFSSGTAGETSTVTVTASLSGGGTVARSGYLVVT